MHKKIIQRALAIVLYCLPVPVLFAQQKEGGMEISYAQQTGAFPLVKAGNAPVIYYDAEDVQVVKIAAHCFADDINRVTGIIPSIDSTIHTSDYCIIAGTIGKNKWIDQLLQKKKINVSAIKGKWESFLFTVVDNPFAGCRQSLVIAGSDPRGTAFGIFELSKMMGVSPFYWWADIVPAHHDELFISKGTRVSSIPSVKYRGIFINDEDWGLQPWAAKTFEPETGDIGPKTYAKVFELLLRLKANLIWPAMHPSTKAFYSYPGNKQVAADYDIIIGSSHAEPMLRNNVGEWHKETMGDFNYITNQQNVYRYWEDRVKESSANEAMYSLGMRGVHDSGIEGVKDPKDAVPLLERIFSDQRKLISQSINKDITKVPQVFTAYKEVLDIYDNNLQVPDDVTLVWPDDNYGYIQRLNNEKEMKRPGGAGIYYHASYWGRPHDYLWLSTTHPSLIREEMMKAYEMKADKVWVLNVGDIKPLEYNIELFMDMAYNVSPFKESSYSKKHLLAWISKIFGREKTLPVFDILWPYYQLAFERRPEFMGWSQTEPTTQTNYSAYNHFFYGDEAQQRIESYRVLEQTARTLRSEIAPKDTNAFYELVYYPVACASLMNIKFLCRDKSYFYAKQNRLSAHDYANYSKEAYNEIIKETNYYNTELANGKWKNIMSMKPRDLPVFQEPVIVPVMTDTSSVWKIIPEGTADTLVTASSHPLELPRFDILNKQEYFVDIFLAAHTIVRWNATVSANWINLYADSGTLTPLQGSNEQRLRVYIDWNKAPANKQLSGTITFTGAGKQMTVAVNASSVIPSGLSHYKGFIENNGIVSMNAGHYSSINNKLTHWEKVDMPGAEAASLQSMPLQQQHVYSSEKEIRLNNPFVSYDFYSFSSATPNVIIFSLPTHPINKNYSARYAISIDDGPVKITDTRTYGRSEEWKQNVLRNASVQKTVMPLLQSGKHTLKIYSVDPGIILNKIIIDLGGLKPAYSSIPETIKKD